MNEKAMKKIPPGMEDKLYKTGELMRIIERRLEDALALRGYNRVVTPGLEYAGMFTGPAAALKPREIYKFDDGDGETLALRPDVTIPILRIAASRLVTENENFPVKVSYIENVFRRSESYGGRKNELTQCGAELLGVAGFAGDIEILTSAAEVLQLCSADCVLEISHSRIFEALADEACLSETEKRVLTGHLENKDVAGYSKAIEAFGKSTPALKDLPLMFGEAAEVLEKMQKQTHSSVALEACAHMEKLVRELHLLGYTNISADLSMASSVGYYTGIIFKGYVHGAGKEILSGGRYDDAAGEIFGVDIPAAGFALCVDEAASACAELSGGDLPPEAMIHAASGYSAAEMSARRLREQGVSCEVSPFSDAAETEKYAKMRRVKRIMTV